MKKQTTLPASLEKQEEKKGKKIISLSYYRIKKSLQQEGFDLLPDENGRLRLVIRTP